MVLKHRPQYDGGPVPAYIAGDIEEHVLSFCIWTPVVCKQWRERLLFFPLTHVAIWASIHAQSAWFVVLERVPCFLATATRSDCRICKQAIQTWVLPTSQLARRVSTTRSPQTDSQGSSPSSRPHSSCFIICPHSPFVIISSCTSIDVRYFSSDSSASNFYEPSAPSQEGVPAQRQDGGGTAGMPGKLGTDWGLKLIVAAENLWFYCKFHQCLHAFFILFHFWDVAAGSWSQVMIWRPLGLAQFHQQNLRMCGARRLLPAFLRLGWSGF